MTTRLQLAGGGALHRHVAQAGSASARIPPAGPGSMPVSARVFDSASIAMRTVAALGVASHSRGLTQPSCSSFPPARRASTAPSRPIAHLRMPAGADDPAVERAHERPGERRGLDEHEVALPHARRVVDEDLREPLVAGIRHARRPRRAPRAGTGSRRNRPAFQTSSPSAYTSPSSRRSQIMSQCSPDVLFAAGLGERRARARGASSRRSSRRRGCSG